MPRIQDTVKALFSRFHEMIKEELVVNKLQDDETLYNVTGFNIYFDNFKMHYIIELKDKDGIKNEITMEYEIQ